MSAKQLVSFLGKSALFASVASASLLTTTTSASPIGSGFDLFTSNDALGNSLGAAVDLGAFGLGIVPLQGVPFPFPPSPFPDTFLFPVDTIVERMGNLSGL